MIRVGDINLASMTTANAKLHAMVAPIAVATAIKTEKETETTTATTIVRAETAVKIAHGHLTGIQIANSASMKGLPEANIESRALWILIAMYLVVMHVQRTMKGTNIDTEIEMQIWGIMERAVIGIGEENGNGNMVEKMLDIGRGVTTGTGSGAMTRTENEMETDIATETLETTIGSVIGTGNTETAFETKLEVGRDETMTEITGETTGGIIIGIGTDETTIEIVIGTRTGERMDEIVIAIGGRSTPTLIATFHLTAVMIRKEREEGTEAGRRVPNATEDSVCDMM